MHAVGVMEGGRDIPPRRHALLFNKLVNTIIDIIRSPLALPPGLRRAAGLRHEAIVSLLLR